MQKESVRMTSEVLSELIIRLYTPVDGGRESFKLYEDDGITDGYISGNYLLTEITCERSGDEVTLTFTPSGKGYDSLPDHRKVRIELAGEGNETELVETEYDTKTAHRVKFKINQSRL